MLIFNLGLEQTDWGWENGVNGVLVKGMETHHHTKKEIKYSQVIFLKKIFTKY
ncbi:MAG: hypothetical protein IJ853_00005 [Rickettsiales bacterium]|nr:hypothetical protein [Rickettsiales bacterium]